MGLLAHLIRVQPSKLAEVRHDVAELCDVQAGTPRALLHLQEAERSQHFLRIPALLALFSQQQPA